MRDPRVGFEWGKTFLAVVSEIRSNDAVPGGGEPIDELVDRYRIAIMHADKWRLQQLENLRMYPQPREVVHFGVRMLCYGILVGSASRQEDDDSVIAGLFNKMVEMSATHPEDEVAPGLFVHSPDDAKNDRALFVEHVQQSLLDEEEFEDLMSFMAWGCEIAGIGVIVGNRAKGAA